MKFAEHIEFATRTNQLDFDEDPISEKRIFRTISNVSNVDIIADQWVNKVELIEGALLTCLLIT